MRPLSSRSVVVACTLGTLAPVALAQEKLHFTYLWHLEQPIYWPDANASNTNRYERAWESIQRTDGGAAHPGDNLRSIFGLDDRVNAYQWRVRDSINAMLGQPEAGAQVSYSGGLIENISSLGNAGQLGYSSSWYGGNRTARSWSTTAGATGAKPRLDIVVFPFHHPLLPLIDNSALRKEIQLYKSVYPDAWGASPAVSRGLFPSEMAFSERLIEVLAQEGIAWTFVSAEKISRACSNFPVVYGSGGVNCDPPNRADQTNAAQTNYFRQSISRGCGPAEAYPFAFTPHRAQYVNPDTGAVSSIIVVPCSQSLGWKDGYAPIGTGDFGTLQLQNNPSRPMLVVLAHDGDNAWGGGYSYYMEATPQLVSQGAAAGYVPTVVEKYLAKYPVPANDIAHVEDGAWVNADGDFGSPQMLNWNWPLLNASGQIDIAGGWHEDERNWAVITAAQNRVDTAEQITIATGGSINIRKILYPDATSNNAEKAWHFFLGSLNSGYMYYGTSGDMEVKPTIACNEAVTRANLVIGVNPNDTTPPTIWIPQRTPWNPGSTNFGPQYGYQQRTSNGDFWVWTFAYDVSGMTSVNLKYRLDGDGTNAAGNTQNETYAGGADVGAWQTLPMTQRAFPAGNVFNNGSIDFFEMPQYIADQYSAQVLNIRDKLVDYYVEATDTRGNIKRSPIQHVYVGTGSGGGPTGTAVAVSPTTPIAGQSVTVAYDPAGRVLAGAATVKMHWGINTWTQVTDTQMLAGTGADVGKWIVTITLPGAATQFDCVFNNAGPSTPPTIWDNNSGADWHFTVTPGGPPAPQWTMDGIRDTASTLVASNSGSGGGMSLFAGLIGDDLYVACPDAGEGNDHFIFVAGADGAGALRAAPWAKAGQVAAWRCFLADENNNAYSAWNDQGAARAQAATGANGGVLEGTLNLRDLFGTIPASVYLAVGPYPSADGTSLLPQYQVPASLDSNTTLNANEYIRVDLCTLGPSFPSTCCVADMDNGTGAGTPDGGVGIEDLLYYLAQYDAGGSRADVDSGAGTGVPDGGVGIEDLLYFLARYDAGC
jgi:hypothetical protein